MAKRTIATPGHSGGSGFDIMSSPGAQPPAPAPPKSAPGGWGELIFLGLIVAGIWVLGKWEDRVKE